jgi:hypothetical protein
MSDERGGSMEDVKEDIRAERNEQPMSLKSKIVLSLCRKKKEYPHFFKWGMNFSPVKAIFSFPTYYNKNIYPLN